MNSNTIIYESKTPAKTFKKQIYLFLGVIMTGLGVYYFVSQANFGRPGEYIPLGLSLIIGLYFLMGFLMKWKIPGSKSSYRKREFFINPTTLDLEYYFESSILKKQKEILFSLKGVDSVSHREERETKTSNTQRIRMDSSKTTPLSESSPSGLYVEKLSNTYVERRWFLIFSPSNEELLLKVKVPYLDSFVRDLNNLLEEVKNEKQKTHSKN